MVRAVIRVVSGDIITMAIIRVVTKRSEVLGNNVELVEYSQETFF